MSKSLYLFVAVALFLSLAGNACAYIPRIVSGDKVLVLSPEPSQTFYGELKGQAAEFDISSASQFNLFVNIMVPKSSNPDGRYAVNIFQVRDGKDELISFLDPGSLIWQEIWEGNGRDLYFKGPEFDRQLEPGDYKIVVTGNNNQGQYALVIGKNQAIPFDEIWKMYYVLPLLKINYFHSSVFEFLKTPFVLLGAMAVVVVFLFIDIIFYLIGKAIKKTKPKSILD